MEDLGVHGDFWDAPQNLPLYNAFSFLVFNITIAQNFISSTDIAVFTYKNT